MKNLLEKSSEHHHAYNTGNMPTMSVIFTIHEENGHCNSFELYKIIEQIAPDVIFEALQETVFNDIYRENKQTTLASTAIKPYLKYHPITHRPVDTYQRPDRYDDNCHHMLKEVRSQATMESSHYRNLSSNLACLESQYGFSFLNCDRNDEIFKELDSLKAKVLNAINDDHLFRIATLEKEVLEKREDTILHNVYSYIKAHPYKKALLLMDSAHRQSFIKKMEARQDLEKMKVHWGFYNNGAGS